MVPHVRTRSGQARRRGNQLIGEHARMPIPSRRASLLPFMKLAGNLGIVDAAGGRPRYIERPGPDPDRCARGTGTSNIGVLQKNVAILAKPRAGR